MLKAAPGTRDLPVVVCRATTGVIEGLLPQLEAWGVPLVPKPFDNDAFLGTVRTQESVAGEPS